MSLKQEEIVKKNLAFVYGRSQGQDHLDPDKHSYIRTSAINRETAAFEGKDISTFTGDHAFLAPDYPCSVFFDGDFSSPYPSYEHAFIASKLANHPDKVNLCRTIRAMDNIREVKKFVNKHVDDIAWWKDKCNIIAETLLRDKFFRSKELRQQLLHTERRNLTYGNDHHEMIWGIHLPTSKGDNMLGKLLMKIRSEIDQGSDLLAWLQHSILGNDISASYDRLVLGSIGVIVHDDKDHLVDDDCKIMKKKATSNMLYATIGKHMQREIVVMDDSVSRQHAVIIVAPSAIINHLTGSSSSEAGLLLIDLGSDHHTYVNHQVIASYQPVFIDNNHIISFGSYKHKYRFDYMVPASISRQQQQGDIYTRIVSSGAVGEAADRNRLENTVYVGNLSYDTSEATIKQLFASCGSLAKDGWEFPRDRATGQPRGYALLTFQDQPSVTKALFRDGDEVDGRRIRVKRSDRSSSSSSGSHSNSGSHSSNGEKRSAEQSAYGLHKRQAR